MPNKNSNIPSDAVWIMYSSEDSDPYFSKFISKDTIVPSAVILNNDKKILFVHELDKENIKDFDGQIMVYSQKMPLIQGLLNSLREYNYPSSIYMNFSDKLDSQTDVLGHGTFKYLTDNILSYYNLNNIPKPNFLSADEFIYYMLETKTEEDIKYLKIAANRALQILEATFRKIKVGMTEKQIANITQFIFSKKPFYFKNHGIVKEELAWQKNTCPIVLVGENLQKGGHSAPSSKKLEFGDTIYFDFGVKITLANGKSYSSDIQRMGYALKKGEKFPPLEVQKVFLTLVNAIELGIKNMKPNVKGFEIDKLVRDHILAAEYPNYNHATGHPVGELAHSPGTSISPKGYKKSALCLKENGTYTIEPRIQIKNGGSIEEMVQVTKNGGVTLCPPQKKLYLVK